ncbi:MAG: NAD-binding protein [Chloroflexi bacterium]|nr:NAD-binding protein [Chloroflexota bacterium]
MSQRFEDSPPSKHHRPFEDSPGSPTYSYSAYTMTEAQLQNLEQMSSHVIVCGLRNTGYRIVEQLLLANVGVVIIDNAPDPRFAEIAQHKGVPLLYRDSRSEHSLLAAGIKRASALITVTENDLFNLETTLVAHELAPDIRAVASFFNQQIGERMINSIPNARALSISELTAPTFVTASLPSQILHLFEIGTEQMAVVRDEVGSNSTLQQLYGPITPIVHQSKGQPDQSCPPPNTPLQEGDRVTLVGRVEELVRLEEVQLDQRNVEETRRGLEGIRQRNDTTKKKRKKQQRVFLTPRLLLRDMERPYRRALVATGLILLISTLFFWLTNPERTKGNPITAFYLTLISIGSNAGIDDLPEWYHKLYASGLIVVGTALLAIIYAYVTNYIVSARINQALGQQKATTMKNHVILCGLGAIGYLVLRGLVERGEAVVVLETNEKKRFNNLARNLGVPVLHADMRVPESLDLVNISKARCITILTNDDLANLETALNALQKNSRVRVVLRLFDRGLADRIEQGFNIQIARSTSALVAPYFIAAALNFEVVTSFYVGQTPFFVAKLVIKEGLLNGTTVSKLYTTVGVIVMAHLTHEVSVENQIEGTFTVRQHSPTFHPNPDFVLQTGDTIYFVGPYERITSIYRLNLPNLG